MLKFLFKSTLYYFLLTKYKSKILSTIFSIILIVVVSLLYNDIVQYMAINNLKTEILYLLIIKWLIYIFSAYKILSNIKSIMFGDKEDESKYQEEITKKEKYIENLITEKINEKYKEIQDKPILESKKDSIYNKYKS